MELSRDRFKGIIQLKAFEVAAILWAEREHAGSGRFPTETEFRKRFGSDFDFRAFVNHPTVQLSFKNRGVPMPKDGAYPEELTAEQVAAVMAITNFADKRSHNLKLKSLGLTPGVWAGWLKNEIFKRYLHDVSTNMLGANLHTVQEGLLRAAEKGSVDGIKFFYELQGLHTGESTQDSNVKQMLAKLVEVLQLHVKDEKLLRSIGNDFAAVMDGRPLPSLQLIEAQRLDI